MPTNENLDVCKAYKLVSEAGKLVNLADWFGAFEVALEEEEDDIGENDDGKETVTVESSSSILRSRRRKVISTRSSRNGGDSLREDQNSRDANGSHKNGMDVDGNEDDSEDEETARIRNHQARFLAAAGDLAYLGYIQPTKRKVEHVARVVF